MDEDKIHEAIGQMIVTCDLKMEGYQMVSARGILYELGYTTDEADEVIGHIAAGGFTYCLDRSIPHKGATPVESVCYWGPDQLKSRLQCLR